MIFLREVSLS